MAMILGDCTLELEDYGVAIYIKEIADNKSYKTEISYYLF
jgi:hypothetical protein